MLLYVKEDHFTMPNAMRLSHSLFSSSINSRASNSYAEILTFKAQGIDSTLHAEFWPCELDKQETLATFAYFQIENLAYNASKSVGTLEFVICVIMVKK
jgi:hypothetical protein